MRRWPFGRGGGDRLARDADPRDGHPQPGAAPAKALMMVAGMTGTALMGAVIFSDSLLLPVGAAACAVVMWAAGRVRNQTRR